MNTISKMCDAVPAPEQSCHAIRPPDFGFGLNFSRRSFLVSKKRTGKTTGFLLYQWNLPADCEVSVNKRNRDDVHGYVALEYAEPHEHGANLQWCGHKYTTDVVEDEAVPEREVLNRAGF